MKIIKLILSGIFLVGLLAGCNAKSTGANPALNVDTKSGKGALMVYRPVNPIWRHKRFNIYINGEYKDILMDKSHRIYNLPAGKYIVEMREDVDIKPEIFKVEVEVTENKTKYLKFGTQSVGGHLKFRRVIKAVAVDDYDWYNGGY